MTSRNSGANGKPTVITDRGEYVEAVEPVIISASRSTDIPAFYSEWFFNRVFGRMCSIGNRPTFRSGGAGLWCFGQRTRSRLCLICMSLTREEFIITSK